jgi:hypothetical protein
VEFVSTRWSRHSNSYYFLRLTQSFKTDQPVYAGIVKYVDYDRTFIPDGNTYDPYMHKRLSFEHEREVRAITSNHGLAREIWQEANHSYGPTDTTPHPLGIPEDFPAGLNVPVNLAHLVETIYVSPEVDRWFAELIEKLIRRYGHPWPIYHSDLNKDPVY